MKISNKILEGQVFGLSEHKYKNYGDMPYSIHLIMVASFVQKYIHLIPEKDREDVIIACWLHDSMEDNGASFNKVKRQFGQRIAEIVFCVTNEMGRDRHEKALKTYPKTSSNRLAVFVKLADRLANSTFSKLNKDKNSSKFETYYNEYELFKRILYSKGEYEDMWKELEQIYEIELTIQE